MKERNNKQKKLEYCPTENGKCYGSFHKYVLYFSFFRSKNLTKLSKVAFVPLTINSHSVLFFSMENLSQTVNAVIYKA